MSAKCDAFSNVHLLSQLLNIAEIRFSIAKDMDGMGRAQTRNWSCPVPFFFFSTVRVFHSAKPYFSNMNQLTQQPLLLNAVFMATRIYARTFELSMRF